MEKATLGVTMESKSYSLRSERSGEQGTSLIEIAVVLIIFAIVIAFALPVVANSIRSYNLRSAAARIVGEPVAVHRPDEMVAGDHGEPPLLMVGEIVRAGYRSR